MDGPERRFLARSLTVIAYAVAMAYLESAVVVYLQGALSIDPSRLFPLQQPPAMGGYAAIEVGREAATIVMLAAVGWLGGRGNLERLAWTAVAFGAWDIAYYGWLWVFIGWPPSLGTWDLLFLIPVPWAAPVWAPCLVSAALVGFGLAAAWEAASGRRRLHASAAQAALALAGGALVILSFTIHAPRIASQAVPGDYAWPLFFAGMGLAATGAVWSLRTAESH